MAQINLLKQNTSTGNSWGLISRLIVRFLILVLVVLIGYYAWLFVQSGKISKDIIAAKSNIETAKRDSLVVAGRNQVLTRQQQLKALNDLLSGHIYWSKIIPKIAEATLKKAAYTSFKINTTGDLVLSVNVPTLEDLEKYLQVFNEPEINKNFSYVRISGYHKVQTAEANSISFDVSMKFNKALVQYSE